MRTLIFIDGENLRYSINGMGLREGDINWSKFLKRCLTDGDYLIRAYWYQAEKPHDPKVRFAKAYEFVKKSSGETDGNMVDAVEQFMEKSNVWKEEQHKKYRKKIDYFDRLSGEFPEIEMVRKGIIKIDPYKRRYLGEKGLDVALSIGMVRLQEHCDKIILISGDMDYVEAIQFIKDKLKTVHIVRLFRGEPPVNRSTSRRLREAADRVIDLYESEIKISMRK